MDGTKAPWARVPMPPGVPTPTPSTAAVVPAVAPAMPPTTTSVQTDFKPAVKRITTDADLKAFLKSESLQSFMAFILYLNQSIQGKTLSDVKDKSAAVSKVVDLLASLTRWIDEIPPSAHTLRYGNPAFRTWMARLAQESEALVKSLLPISLQGVATELLPYFLDSFGNATRIDYGTGHETNFCAFLFCLGRLGLFSESDAAGLVAYVMNDYLKLMRKLQTTYWLEPAGSHGVWGLDDYQFLPFVWGSSQLVGHPMIRPKSIHNPDILTTYEEQYLLFQCVQFVKKVKKGALQETSPMIDDITRVPNWTKVNSGLIKMYQVEVLSKFPIMQHFLFGSLFAFP